MGAWAATGIQAMTSTHEIHLSRLGSGEGKPVAIFLAFDPDMIEELRPLTASFFLDVYRTLGQTARMSPGGAFARDVMIYGDEWGNIGFIPRFIVALNLLRSAGVYVFQTLTQAVKTYDEQSVVAIKAACGTKIGLSNMIDDDATWFSESVLGQATEVAQSSTVPRGRFHVTTDRGDVSQSETKRALLTPDEVMNMREDELLVKMPRCPAARLTQCRYYSDPEVRDRAPARGENWIGYPRWAWSVRTTPLEPPAFDDALIGPGGALDLCVGDRDGGRGLAAVALHARGLLPRSGGGCDAPASPVARVGRLGGARARVAAWTMRRTPSTQITRDRDHAVSAADTHSSHKIFGLPSGIAFIVL